MKHSFEISKGSSIPLVGGVNFHYENFDLAIGPIMLGEDGKYVVELNFKDKSGKILGKINFKEGDSLALKNSSLLPKIPALKGKIGLIQEGTLSFDADQGVFAYKHSQKLSCTASCKGKSSMLSLFQKVILLIKSNIKNIEQVRGLEVDDRAILSSRAEGALADDTTKAYSDLIKAYTLINSRHLREDQLHHLLRASDIFSQLSEDAKWQSDNLKTLYIERVTKAHAPEGLRAEDISSLFESRLKEAADRGFKKLRDGSMYMSYGFTGSVELTSAKKNKIIESGHHEIIRLGFKQESGKPIGTGIYNITIYNAGGGAVRAAAGDVKSIRKYELKFTTVKEAKEFIRLLYKRKNLGRKGVTKAEFDEVQSKIDKQLGRELKVVVSRGQKLGNCATRSNREALKDMLSPVVFKRVYGFISDVALGPGGYIKKVETAAYSFAKSSYPVRITTGKDLKITKKFFSLVNKGSIAAAKSLLQGTGGTKIDLNYIEPRTGQAAIHIIASKGYTKLFDSYAKAGGRLDLQDAFGNTPLHLVIREDKEGIKDKLLKFKYKGKVGLHLSNQQGLTPLMQAITLKKPGIVEDLLIAGASYKYEDNKHISPVIKAIETKDVEVLKALLRWIPRNDPLLFELDGLGDNAFIVAAQMKSKDMTKALLDRASPASKIFSTYDLGTIRRIGTFLITTDDLYAFKKVLNYLHTKRHAMPLICEVSYKDTIRGCLERAITYGANDIFKYLQNEKKVKLSFNRISRYAKKHKEDITKDKLVKLFQCFKDKSLSQEQVDELKQTLGQKMVNDAIKEAGITILEVTVEPPERPATPTAELEALDAIEQQDDEFIGAQEERAEQRQYQFGDITRSIITAVKEYQFGDLTRGALAWITGDQSWNRTSTTSSGGGAPGFVESVGAAASQLTNTALSWFGWGSTGQAIVKHTGDLSKSSHTTTQSEREASKSTGDRTR